MGLWSAESSPELEALVSPIALVSQEALVPAAREAGGGELRHRQDGAMAMRAHRGELFPVASIRHHLAAHGEGLGKEKGEQGMRRNKTKG